MSTENDTDGTLLDIAMDLLRDVPAEYTSEEWFNDRADLGDRFTRMRARLRMAEQEQTSEAFVTRGELAWLLDLAAAASERPSDVSRGLLRTALRLLYQGKDARGPEHDCAEGSDG